MKMRLIFTKNKYSILMNKVIDVLINNQWYYKSDYKDSKEIQNFYRLMRDNIESIQQIIYKSEDIRYKKDPLNPLMLNSEVKLTYHDFVKNKMLHNLLGPARIKFNIENNIYEYNYYINDKQLLKDDFEKNKEVKRFQRKIKIIELMEGNEKM